jgi:hypothetical protein
MARALSRLEPEHAVAALGVDSEIRFDFVVGRDLFTHLPASGRDALARFLLAVLAPGGVLSISQVIPRLGQRLSSLVRLDDTLSGKLAAAEERAYCDPSNDLVNWRHDDLADAFRAAGARAVSVETEPLIDVRRVTERELALWLAPGSSYGRELTAQLSAGEVAQVHHAMRAQLIGGESPWTSMVAFVVART